MPIPTSESELAALFARLGAAGPERVDPVVLNEMIRCAQATMIFRIGNLLDGAECCGLEELSDVSWALFQTDADGRPTGPAIGGLHESVLELDPTGREMRPPEALRAIASRNEAGGAAPS